MQLLQFPPQGHASHAYCTQGWPPSSSHPRVTPVTGTLLPRRRIDQGGLDACTPGQVRLLAIHSFSPFSDSRCVCKSAGCSGRKGPTPAAAPCPVRATPGRGTSASWRSVFPFSLYYIGWCTPFVHADFLREAFVCCVFE